MVVLALRFVGFTALLVGSSAQDLVTPVEKVITLLENMKANVTQDGENEALSYQTFACWCKDTTKQKSTAITTGKDTIEGLSTEIAQKTASKVLKEGELATFKAEHEATIKELADETATYEKAKTVYEAKSADLNKALSSLEGAINAMKTKKDAISSSFLELRHSLAESLALADALNLISAPKQQVIGAFIQQKVDPADPSYKYHSNDIIKVLEDLKVDFSAEKSEVDTEWGKTHSSYEGLKATLTTKIGLKAGEISSTESAISTLISEIATARGSLVESQGLLKDDELYMKDMTAQCETTAKDWDQQSAMRASEISTLTEAISVLKDEVAPADVVNIRALLVQKQAKKSAVQAHAVPEVVKAGAAPAVHTALSQMQTKRSPTFLQLHRASAEDRRNRVADMLQKEGEKIGSPVLSALSMQIAKDPFAKVKGLIEQLIVRLVAESTAEATKKGYCDTEIAKASEERDYRWADALRLNQEASALEVKRDELTQELDELTNELIPGMKSSLASSETQRGVEKADNLQTLATAKEGLDAVTKALKIITTFYRKSGRAKVLLQRVSPIEEDMPSVTAGAYKGKQEQKVAVISLLEQIQDDFERTIKATTEMEAQAQSDYVEFQKVGKSALSKYETKRDLDQEDLATTLTNLDKTMGEMNTNIKLTDEALKQLEFLKPTCTDSGMSYSERKAKREEEIVALKKALCILDTDGVEAECAE